ERVRLAHGLARTREAAETITPIHVHAVRTAHSLAAGSPEYQSSIKRFDMLQYVEHHAVPEVIADFDRLHVRLGVVPGVVTIKVHLYQSLANVVGMAGREDFGSMSAR